MKTIVYLHADFPAPDGPIISILRVGNDSSAAMIVIVLCYVVGREGEERL